ncbi:hypothetical protein Leryth_020224 [Lithospermum erythrorhizon]|nr:hypothetical protein Leryth_020224 [Lithospermum erythrorhizon]
MRLFQGLVSDTDISSNTWWVVLKLVLERDTCSFGILHLLNVGFGFKKRGYSGEDKAIFW